MIIHAVALSLGLGLSAHAVSMNCQSEKHTAVDGCESRYEWVRKKAPAGFGDGGDTRADTAAYAERNAEMFDFTEDVRKQCEQARKWLDDECNKALKLQGANQQTTDANRRSGIRDINDLLERNARNASVYSGQSAKATAQNVSGGDITQDQPTEKTEASAGILARPPPLPNHYEE